MNHNVRITRGIKALLRLVSEQMQQEAPRDAAKAHRILTSGQRQMRLADLNHFQRLLGA
jgi:hypothetical protein